MEQIAEELYEDGWECTFQTTVSSRWMGGGGMVKLYRNQYVLEKAVSEQERPRLTTFLFKL